MTEQYLQPESGRNYRPGTHVMVKAHDAMISRAKCPQCHKHSRAIWVENDIALETCLNGCEHPTKVLTKP